ncbi:hypothetical protein WN944_018458 [Citrus x changshan-huyou]|uniref:Uncharacterized protein n=1 Tax=Citrus x changshan-huyou TaxID=2935761 RepID=A0AAP0QEV0_9ROSI
MDSDLEQKAGTHGDLNSLIILTFGSTTEICHDPRSNSSDIPVTLSRASRAKDSHVYEIFLTAKDSYLKNKPSL